MVNTDGLYFNDNKNGIAYIKYTETNNNTGLHGYIETLENFVIAPRVENARNYYNGLA